MRESFSFHMASRDVVLHLQLASFGSCPDNCGSVLSTLAVPSPSTQNITEVIFCTTSSPGQPLAPLTIQLYLLCPAPHQPLAHSFVLPSLTEWKWWGVRRCSLPQTIRHFQSDVHHFGMIHR